MPGTTLPANLRLILALSLALCLHTLLLLGLPGPDHPPQPPQHPLNLTLLATGTPAPLPAAPASTPPGRRSSDMPTASRPDRRHTTSPHPATGQATDVPTPAAHPKPQPLQRPAVSGAARRTPQEATPPSPTQTVGQLTQRPSEHMSYHDQLALRIAEVMARQPLPGVRQLKEVRRIRLELYLMANGTLTRARVMTSSGIESMDSAAYRAALAASPYPEPPGGKKGKGGEERFEVDVEVTPRSATGVRG